MTTDKLIERCFEVLERDQAPEMLIKSFHDEFEPPIETLEICRSLGAEPDTITVNGRTMFLPSVYGGAA